MSTCQYIEFIGFIGTFLLYRSMRLLYHLAFAGGIFWWHTTTEGEKWLVVSQLWWYLDLVPDF
jgi:hypothetical protein